MLPRQTLKENVYTYHIKEVIFKSNFHAKATKISLLVALGVFVVVMFVLPFILAGKYYQISQSYVRYPTDLKYILFWEPPRHKKLAFHKKQGREFPIGQKWFLQKNCRYINCYISYNQHLLNNEPANFDAVVINARDISKFKHTDFNITRSPHQKYIFRSHESAEKYTICNPLFDNFFNMTWTYKLDSDIPHPFINIYDAKNKLVGPKKNMDWIPAMNHSKSIKNNVNEKKKAVAWVVTKCKLKTKHMDFIRSLRQELAGYNYSVDVYGPCGDIKCPGGLLSKCYKLVEKKYYFQMVIEDYYATDYVTEKIVKALSYLTVPLVYGGADYTRFLPPGGYINIQAFDINKLGSVIDYLIKNPRMYEYFFDWKNHYFFTERYRTDICELCTKLNNYTGEYETYNMFREWWNWDYRDVCERNYLVDKFNSFG